MGKTVLDIRGGRFFINGRETHSDPSGTSGTEAPARGRLPNARFIQGIFDDASGRGRYARFGYDRFDPEENTDRLIAALPAWRSHGLLAFTVGFQGGGPCFTMDSATIDNNPFGSDGLRLDKAYAARMDRLIRAADALGMVVIVSFFYFMQSCRLQDDIAVLDAVQTGARFLRDGGYTNVILEVANEHDLPAPCGRNHPQILTSEGMVSLIHLAREASGGLPTGCSRRGGSVDPDICAASDVVLIHGNGCTRQGLHDLILRAHRYAPDKPVVCNEDSPALGQMDVALRAGASWGYYNNLTKQEPPADWGITPGEDRFFALRTARSAGIAIPDPPEREQFLLQGAEPHEYDSGRRWIRLASLYPERIDRIEFFRDGAPAGICYDEPFTLGFRSNWNQDAVKCGPEEVWTARVHLRDGRILTA
ncbi:MAG: hypothetical protein KBA30_09940 [Clostridia bacterium]|nr:hypothetical protein [Clostridia bacterium]